jgi:hypothetical protein
MFLMNNKKGVLVLVLVRDETADGRLVNAITLSLAEDTLTVGALIEARVRAEARRYNQRGGDYFRGLVRPLGSARTPLGYKLPRGRRIDEEKQVAAALSAFRDNRFRVSIDGYPARDLEEKVRLDNDTRVCFVQLMPITG